MGYGGLLNTVVDPFGIGNASAPGVPNAKNVGNQYSQLIQAYLRNQGAIYDSEAEYKPKYTALDLDQFDMGVPRITSAMVNSNTALRTGNTADFAALAPGAAETYRSLNPDATALLAKLNKTAMAGLDAGTQLTPEEQAQVNNSVRGAQGARGVSYGPAPAYSEVLANGEFGQGLLSQRQKSAEDVASLNLNDSNSMMSTIMNLVSPQSQAPVMAASVAGGSGPTLMPTNQSYDLLNTAYNASAASKIAGANNAAAENSY